MTVYWYSEKQRAVMLENGKLEANRVKIMQDGFPLECEYTSCHFNKNLESCLEGTPNFDDANIVLIEEGCYKSISFIGRDTKLDALARLLGLGGV